MTFLEHYWHTRPWLMITGGCGLVYFAVMTFHIIPAGYELLMLRRQSLEQQDRIEQSRTRKSEERLALARIQHLKDYLHTARSKRPPAEGMDEVLTLLDDAAQKAGLTVTALTAETVVTGEDQTAWPLKILAVGSYHQAGRFMDQLERSGVWMIVNTLELTAASVKHSGVTLRLDLTVYCSHHSQEVP